MNTTEASTPEDILELAQRLRWEVGSGYHDSLMEALYGDAARIADRVVIRPDTRPRFDLDRTIDRLVTSRWLGFPIMILLFTLVFWITITGANVPSAMIAELLLNKVHPFLKGAAATIGIPWWLDGLLLDGIYLATAWVVSVMLPPMAIFFPLFTLLEDFGYLPRMAFNLDNLFNKTGAHGKQALSMMMGFGCNAAGIIATRIIDSPRERLIAMITNNFALCNGRWPTQILIATLFIGALVPAQVAGLISAMAVVGIALLGVLLTFVINLAPLPIGVKGRSFYLQPGTTPLPSATNFADLVYLPHRPDHLRPLAGHHVRRAGRRRDLVECQYPDRRN